MSTCQAPQTAGHFPLAGTFPPTFRAQMGAGQRGYSREKRNERGFWTHQLTRSSTQQRCFLTGKWELGCLFPDLFKGLAKMTDAFSIQWMRHTFTSFFKSSLSFFFIFLGRRWKREHWAFKTTCLPLSSEQHRPWEWRHHRETSCMKQQPGVPVLLGGGG